MCSKLLLAMALLFVVCEVIVVESLKAGAPGVCDNVKQYTVRRTKSRMVATTRWCGPKKCVVKRYKPITYIKTEHQLVCCRGFVYQAQSDSCIPSCSTGCFGGRCVAPETCQCEPPAYLHPQRANTCITPTCDPPCINAECINSTCTCLANSNRFNSTHCYSCDAGQTIDANFTCKPICAEGYTLKGGVCEPTCTNFENGRCVAPNTCECLEGYVNVSGKCEPVCECRGRCVAPNVCECPDGYRNVTGNCEPICDACVNGFCSAPNVCSCDEGYAKNSTTGECYDCSESCENCDASGVCLDCGVL